MHDEAARLIEAYRLEPHPEGGYYRETYRSDDLFDTARLPDRYSGPRNAGSAILYLITGDSFSSIHRLKSDEIFHFYTGDPVTMLVLDRDGGGYRNIMGPAQDQAPLFQCTVPRDCWQGTRLCDGGRFAFLGTTVAPAFDFGDFEVGERDELLRCYPAFKEEIIRLTHEQ